MLSARPSCWPFPSYQSICVCRRGPPASLRLSAVFTSEAHPRSTRGIAEHGLQMFHKENHPRSWQPAPWLPPGELEPPLRHADPGVSFPPTKWLAALLPKNVYCFSAVFIAWLVLDACVSMSAPCNGSFRNKGHAVLP